ncbi:MAG: DUF2478 domain-containing protein [Hyphomicrobiaceae bacterium]|nr:DUF2478 domain-containing protein [Hyphomicrobiaceae bacterium]
MDQGHMSPNRLAAVVYDDGDSVDALLSAFARELLEAGTDIAGLVQMPPAEGSCGPSAPMCLRDVRTGMVLPIGQDLGPGARSCKLDPGALAAAAVMLRAMAERPCDLLFISKFSKQEAAGRGFRDEFAFAVEHGRTVLTGVRRGLVHHWLDFTGGDGTLLDCRLSALRHWWSGVSPPRLAA